MRLYGFEPQTVTFPWGKMQVVSLGEEGRGRKLTYVPFQAEFDVNKRDYELATTRKGLPKITRCGIPTNAWIAKLSGSGTYTRGTHGTVYVLNEYVGNVFVVAYGYGAYGDAGRIGDWWEYLVTVREPAVFLVRHAGGSDKRQRYYVIFKDRWVYEVFPEELALAKTLGLYDLENPNTLVKAYKNGDRDRLVELRDLIKKDEIRI